VAGGHPGEQTLNPAPPLELQAIGAVVADSASLEQRVDIGDELAGLDHRRRPLRRALEVYLGEPAHREPSLASADGTLERRHHCNAAISGRIHVVVSTTPRP